METNSLYELCDSECNVENLKRHILLLSKEQLMQMFRSYNIPQIGFLEVLGLTPEEFVNDSMIHVMKKYNLPLVTAYALSELKKAIFNTASEKRPRKKKRGNNWTRTKRSKKL